MTHTKRAQDTREAYRAREAAQFGALRAALDAGLPVNEAAERAGMDPIIAQRWAAIPVDMWPGAQ